MTSLPIVNASTSFTASVDTEIHTDTSAASFTITLPSNPADQSLIRIIDIGRNWGTFHLTVTAGSGDTVQGQSSINLSSPGSCFNFIFISDSRLWVYFYDDKIDPNLVNNVNVDSTLTSSLSNNNLTLNVNTGSLTEATSSVLTLTNLNNSILKNGTIQVKQATGSQSGYLSSIDWTTFNDKLGSLVSNTSVITVATNVIDLATQAANTIFAGPLTGSAKPTFRSLVTGDYFSSLLSGTFSNGLFPIFNGTNFSPSTNLTWLSNVLNVVGKVTTNELSIRESAEFQGVDTLGTNGRVIVSNTNVTANSRIYLTAQSVSASRGYLFISARTPGSNFTIQSSQNLDRSVIAWLIINPS